MTHAAASSSCPDEQTISLMLQGALDAKALEAIQAHLSTCARCSEELSILMSVMPSLSPEASKKKKRSATDHHAIPTIDRYLIQGVLGAGAMGIVFEARDTQLGRRVALKVLRPDLRSPEAAAARQLREARALATLDHPNILTVFDAGTHKEHLVYMASALIDGETIDVWSRGRSWQEIVGCYEQVCEGLMHAHSRGFVHRDIKPQNILVDRQGRPRICDFGLAHREHTALSSSSHIAAFEPALTQSGALIGTPAYMPPEQLDGQVVGPRADQYALCASLYEALYGFRPHAAQSLEALLRATRSGDVDFPRSAKLPEAIAPILRRGLHPRAEERFEDVEALRQALHQLHASPQKTSSHARVALPALLLLCAAIAITVTLKQARTTTPQTLPSGEVPKRQPPQTRAPTTPITPPPEEPKTEPTQDPEKKSKSTKNAAPREPRATAQREAASAPVDLKALCATGDCERCLTRLGELKPDTFDEDPLRVLERQGAQCAYKLGRCEEAFMWQERALAPTTTEERARLDRSLGMTFHACPLARDAPPERQNEQLIGLIMHATQTKEPKACLATWKKYEPRLRSWTTRPGDLDAATRGAMASTIQELARCIDTTSCEEARASYLTAQHLHHEPDAPHLNQTLARELPRCVTTQDPPDMQLAGTLEQLKRAQRGTQRDCVAAWNTHHAELQALLHTAERDDYFSSTQSILRDHLRCLAPASCELAAQVKPLLVGSAKQLAAISAQLTSHCP